MGAREEGALGPPEADAAGSGGLASPPRGPWRVASRDFTGARQEGRREEMRSGLLAPVAECSTEPSAGPARSGAIGHGPPRRGCGWAGSGCLLTGKPEVRVSVRGGPASLGNTAPGAGARRAEVCLLVRVARGGLPGLPCAREAKGVG